eukprot:9478269-Pyramimonas_sp.AAC.1
MAHQGGPDWPPRRPQLGDAKRKAQEHHRTTREDSRDERPQRGSERERGFKKTPKNCGTIGLERHITVHRACPGRALREARGIKLPSRRGLHLARCSTSGSIRVSEPTAGTLENPTLMGLSLKSDVKQTWRKGCA